MYVPQLEAADEVLCFIDSRNAHYKNKDINHTSLIDKSLIYAHVHMDQWPDQWAR